MTFRRFSIIFAALFLLPGISVAGTGSYVILDVLDDLNREGGFVFSFCGVNSQQAANYFEIRSDTTITKISWSGSVNESGLTNGKGLFVIRIYPDQDGYPGNERLLDAPLTAQGVKVGDGALYVFSYENNAIVQLPAGGYWMSVLDPETNGTEFGWHMEKDKLGTIYGSGGAIKSDPESPWISTNSGVTPIEARGRSLYIEGIEGFKSENVILDVLDDLNREGGFVFSFCGVNSQQAANYFEIRSDTTITKFSWSGSVNESGLTNGKGLFVIRIYPDQDGYPGNERLLDAPLTAQGVKVGDGALYVFSYENNAIVQLPAGGYWMSVLDPETNGTEFGWHMEKDKLGTIYGSGGAIKSDPESPWRATNNGVTPREARGRSLYIEGFKSENIPDTYTLTKTVSPSSGGGISASPDKSVYTDGESVTLTANSEACYDFTGWSGACSGTNSTCSLTTDADKSVTANFTVKKHSVNITANNGSVTKSPNQSSYDCGTTVLLTASPNPGYNFDHWEGDATGTQTTASITMTEEMNVTAVFVSGNHTISGYVRDGDNTGISGVTLNFSNSGGTSTTDSSGFYTRSVSSGWIGTVTPEKSGYSFDPQNRTYSAVTANQSEQNYTAAPQQQDYTLSGYVRDSNNIGISGVTLTFSNSGGSATTNNSGYYTQTVTSGWSGTITPSKQGYTFDPADRSHTSISSDLFNQDYTGIPIPFTISGYVRDSGNRGLSGVRLSFSNYAGSAETDSSGYYSHTVYYGWTGTVTPEKSGYTFTPANLSYTGTSSNHTGQNYTGTPTAVPDIAVSPSSLIFTKPTSRSGRSGAETHTSLPVSQITDRDVSLPTDGEHATGLIIPDHVRKHWKTHTPTRKYRSRQNLPASKDWSVYDSPVKNQGYCGSCWAFATVAMMENLANQANLSVSKDFAEQVLVSCVYTGRGGCSGGWYWDALSYIRQNGLPPENCYPYKTSNGNCGSKCTNPDFLVKIEDFTPQYGLWGSSGFTVQDLKGALQDGPLCVAMYVADDFYSYSGGIYDYTGGNYEWGHAVFLVGYNDSQQYFKVRNSWGTWWGEGGYFRIAYNDVTDNIKFGSYAVAASGIFVDGEGQTEDVIVSNTGTGTLTVSSISSDKAWLEFSPQTLSALAPNEEKTLTLSVGDWNSVASPEETATLTISSDDPDEPSVSITVKAAISVMAARPVLMVSPPFYGNISTASDGNTQIEVPNNSGETYLDVSNGGDGTMTWTTESDNSWLRITQGNTGTDYGKVVIAYEENAGGMRTGTITVSASGAVNSPQYVKIRQTDIDVDADDDGMTDSFEFQHGLDPSNPDDASGDRDEDGLTNLEEYEIGTNPNLEDTDDDGMTDGYEAGKGLDPLAYDEDGSSQFTISDAVTAIRILAGMNASPAGTGADADENGVVEMKDAVYILQEIAGLR
ncbi:C1 family peptidase [Desulfobacterales bacterium HSG2]|nr:C1 family peptidase [Desulfobacterales bacterium HSG2]